MSTTTPPDEKITALVVAQAAVRERLTLQGVAMAEQQARTFTGWYDTAQISEWSAKLATLMQGVQRGLAQNTDAYLARVLSAMTGRKVRPAGRVDVAGLRQGVTHAGAYARAADAYRWQQAQFDRSARDLLSNPAPQPLTLVDPVQAAVDRVAKVADMDAQLAVQAQSRQVMADHQGTVTGFRRVIHPELSRGGSCGLCVVASDRLYGPHALLPIHALCHCTTLPVIEGKDPGSTLNAADLRRLYREAGGTDRSNLKRVRYQVNEHSELGPLLSAKGAPFRTASQARRDTSHGPAKSDAEKAAELRRVRDSVAASLPKARELAGQDKVAWGGYLDRLEARVSDLDHQLAA